MRTRNSHFRPMVQRSTGFNVVHRLVFVIVGLIILVAVGFTVATAVSAQSPENITCTVSSKERVTEVRDGDSVTRLLINTEDCGTLEIGSAIMSGNWSPNQTYSSITEGKTYNFEVYGFNIDVMNSYKQVKSVQEVR